MEKTVGWMGGEVDSQVRQNKRTACGDRRTAGKVAGGSWGAWSLGPSR